MPPALLLVAHGTRLQAGAAMLEALRDAVAARVAEVPVRLAFVDVLEPKPEAALAELVGPVVLVPAFLASGYHVRADLPKRIRRSGSSLSATEAEHRDVRLADTLGPDPALADVMAERLREAGWDPTAHVVLAVAGTNDPAAQAENQKTLRQLETALGTPARLAVIAQGAPRIDEVLAELAGPVFVAQYLLADGLFSRKLAELAANARAITTPLGTHDKVVDLIVRRYLSEGREGA